MRTKIILGILAAGILVCGAGCWGTVALVERVVDFRPAAGELDAAVRDYRAAGMPWTAKDLAPAKPLPPARNAASLLRRANAVVLKQGWSGGDRALRDAMEAGRYEDAAAKLDAYAPTLAVFERATAIGTVDFGRDRDLGVNQLFPEFAPMKSAMKAFGYRARLRAVRGDLTGARADLRAARTLARMAESDGVLISMLVRISGDAIADDAAQRAAALDPGLASMLIEDLKRSDRAPDFARALRSEAYLSLATSRNLTGQLARDSWSGSEGEEKNPTETDPARLVRDGVPDGLIQRAYLARSLQVWTRVAGEMRRASDPGQLGNALDRIEDSIGEDRRVSSLLNQILFPIFGQAGNAVVKDRASRELTLAYLRALETRRRTGRFPAEPIQGNDPFGRPYVVRTEGAGFRLYSLGPNGKDDGGLTSVERHVGDPKGDDIVVVFPPPRRRAAP